MLFYETGVEDTEIKKIEDLVSIVRGVQTVIDDTKKRTGVLVEKIVSNEDIQEKLLGAIPNRIRILTTTLVSQYTETTHPTIIEIDQNLKYMCGNNSIVIVTDDTPDSNNVLLKVLQHEKNFLGETPDEQILDYFARFVNKSKISTKLKNYVEAKIKELNGTTDDKIIKILDDKLRGYLKEGENKLEENIKINKENYANTIEKLEAYRREIQTLEKQLMGFKIDDIKDIGKRLFNSVENNKFITKSSLKENILTLLIEAPIEFFDSSLKYSNILFESMKKGDAKVFLSGEVEIDLERRSVNGKSSISTSYDYIKNPHVSGLNCFSEVKDKVGRLLSSGDIELAVQQLIAGAQSINFADGSARNSFEENIKSTKKFINYKGEMMNYKEFEACVTK